MMSRHTTPSRLLALTALVVAGVLSNSCGKGPTDPSDNVSETFTGTIPFVSGTPGSAVHMFNVSNEGELFVTLVSLTPPLAAAKYAGLWLGVNSSSGCVWNGPQTNFAVPGTVLTNSVREGTFCVAVLDPSSFTVAETYEIRVSHP